MTIEVDPQDIRDRAYALWIERGAPEGTAEDDWILAEQQRRQELEAVSSPLEPLAEKAADVLEEGTTDSPHPSRRSA